MTGKTRTRQSKTRDVRPGFTLVELLVVVSIIALLASILVPAMTRARYVTRFTSCGNNLRQITVACSTYANDYGYYPGYRPPPADTVATQFRTVSVNYEPRLAPYCGGKTPAATVPLWGCPEGVRNARSLYGANWASGNNFYSLFVNLNSGLYSGASKSASMVGIPNDYSDMLRRPGDSMKLMPGGGGMWVPQYGPATGLRFTIIASDVNMRGGLDQALTANHQWVGNLSTNGAFPTGLRWKVPAEARTVSANYAYTDGRVVRFDFVYTGTLSVSNNLFSANGDGHGGGGDLFNLPRAWGQTP